MLEKPDLPDERIVDCLQEDYGLRVIRITFLPLGVDQHAAVYAVQADDGATYFVKVKRGRLEAMSLLLPRHLSEQGIEGIIPPMATLTTGKLWAEMDASRVILYPFVEGRDGYEMALSDRQWVQLGSILRTLQTAELPGALLRDIRRETFDPAWRQRVEVTMGEIAAGIPGDALVARLNAFLQANRPVILHLVMRANRLAEALVADPPPFVLCHADLHAGNLLIESAEAFHIVDWDEPILAPKERDLMFVGGGLMGPWRTPQEEETLFYQGYGRTSIDPVALTYYRYERIIQDISEFCVQIVRTGEESRDREQALHYLRSNFERDGTIDLARRSDPDRGDA